MMNSISSFIRCLCGIFIVLLSACNTRDSRGSFPVSKSRETMVYISEMHYMPETGEFYTPLYFNHGIDEQAPDSLKSLLSTGTGNLKKGSLSLSAARRIFMLTGMDSLYIYDASHRLISRAGLTGISYKKDATEENFVGIYRGDALKTDPAGSYYCVNTLPAEVYISGFSCRTIHDESLDNFIIHNLRADPGIVWDIKNTEVSPGRVIYSVVTSLKESFITEMNNNQFSKVIDINGKYRISSISPLPFEVNHHPLLFIHLYIPGKNVRKTSLAVFADYLEYKILHYNRLYVVNHTLSEKPPRN